MSTVAHLNTSLALLGEGTRQLVATGSADPLVVARLQDAMACLEEAGADPGANVDLEGARGEGGGGVDAIVDAAAELDAIGETDRTPRMLTARTEIGAVLMMVGR